METPMRLARLLAAASCCLALLAGCATPSSPGGSAAGGGTFPAPSPLARGAGGAVSSVNPYASRIGLDVLAHGGNAVDAAVATAAALGVAEPNSAGIGGGGYLLYYDAKTHQVHSIDGRETAPAAMRPNAFVDPATGQKMSFDDAVNSTLSVGVPGTPALWDRALRDWGTMPLGAVLEPSAKLAENGFVIGRQMNSEQAMNRKRFSDFTSTVKLWLPGGQPPPVGSIQRNPELAATYRLLGRDGVNAFYRGPIAADIVNTVNHPPVVARPSHPIRTGRMQLSDLAGYQVTEPAPTHVNYRGLDVYGIGGSSSGGTTDGEALNILGNFPLSASDPVQAMHHYLEASRIAFADRNRWLGDPAFVDPAPGAALLSADFGKARACLITPNATLKGPVAPGDPLHPDASCQPGSGGGQPHEGPSTTHVTTVDKAGNAVSYTLTIEQTGGSGITVPGRGFLLNNELTDFSFVPTTPGVPDPNLPQGGKRPRSSIAPTIVLRGGAPYLVLGSPGGATIITTVLQVLVNRIDLGMDLPAAVAAPRASQRNAARTETEPALLDSPRAAALATLGEQLGPVDTTYSPEPEIGAVEAAEFLPGGGVQAVAEPTRRTGGTALALP
jgi:gamma-glutamyltranspeptidase / glutathione hydrolase